MIEITEISSFVHNDVNYYLTIPTNYTYVCKLENPKKQIQNTFAVSKRFR